MKPVGIIIGLFCYTVLIQSMQESLEQSIHIPFEIRSFIFTKAIVAITYFLHQMNMQDKAPYKSSDRSDCLILINNDAKIKLKQQRCIVIGLLLRYLTQEDTIFVLRHMLHLAQAVTPAKYYDMQDYYIDTLNKYQTAWKLDKKALRMDYTIQQWWNALTDQHKATMLEKGVFELPSFVTSLKDISNISEWNNLPKISLRGGTFIEIPARVFPCKKMEHIAISNPALQYIDPYAFHDMTIERLIIGIFPDLHPQYNIHWTMITNNARSIKRFELCFHHDAVPEWRKFLTDDCLCGARQQRLTIPPQIWQEAFSECTFDK